MSKRTRLLIGLAVGAVALPFLALAIYLLVVLVSLPWPPGPVPVRQCARAAKRAEGTVKAIFEYKHRVGLWPQRLADLEPDAMARARVPGGWYYEWCWWGEWHYGGSGVGFFYDRRYFDHLRNGVPVQHGWHRFWQEGEELLEIPSPTIDTPNVSEDERTQNTLDEFSRRIAREPDDIVHRRGKISLLFRLGRLAEARQESNKCIGAFPDQWSARMALAYIDAEYGRAKEAAATFREWIQTRPSFSLYWYLSDFYQKNGDPGKAVAAVKKAMEYPLAEDGLVPEALACAAAAYAYRQKEFTLALKICEAWEGLSAMQYFVEPSYHTLRAATYLALGRFDEADASLKEAMKLEADRGLWVETTSALRLAVQSRDQSFHDPSLGPSLGSSDPFIQYE